MISSKTSHKYSFYATFFIILLALSVNFAGSVQTINVIRDFNNWKTHGEECRANAKNYWYIFKDKMQNDIKLEAKRNGGSVLYIGIRNGYYLYNQSIKVTCDSIVTILKNDSNFINIMPIIAEEKVTYEIFRDSGICYIDNVKLIFGAGVALNIKINNDLLNQIKMCVDSIDTTRNIIRVYGNRNQMLCVAAKENVKLVYDLKEEKPPTMNNSRQQSKVDTLHNRSLDLVTVPPDTTWNRRRKYTGDGITIAVCEGGDMDSLNLDFNESVDGSLTNLKLRKDPTSSMWNSFSLHKTHVAGIAAGSGWMGRYDTLTGNKPYKFRGVAPKALLSSEENYSYQTGDVNTHSDGSNSRWYYEEDLILDTMIADHDTSFISGKNNIELFSAGNEGYTARGWTKEVGYITLRRHAKNAIHVGSSQKYSNYRSLFSSMGPHRDGRIGPTIVAPGSNISPTLERYYIEIDYIRIRSQSGTIKREWNFNNTANGWLLGHYNGFNIDSNSTSLVLDISHGGSIITDTLDPVIYADSTDWFEIRYRGDDRNLSNQFTDWKGKPREVLISVKWHDINQIVTEPTRLTKWNMPYDVGFFGSINTGWQEQQVPLNRIHQMDSDEPTECKVWPSPTVSPLPLARLAVRFTSSKIISSYLLDDVRYCKYIDMNGTSMSTPHVAGITALMLQKYNDEIILPRNTNNGTNLNIHKHPLWPSTIRAILIHTAKDLVADDSTFFYEEAADPDLKTSPAVYGVGPDWATGYGLVQADEAMSCVDTTRFIEDTISDGSTISYSFYVPNGTEKLKVSLAWDDPSPSALVRIERSSAFENKLVNNLDLRLKKNSNTYYPWTLDHTIFNDTIPEDGVHDISATTILQNSAVRNRPDTLNNAEVVEVDSPASGLWVVEVQGTSIRFDQDPSTIIDDQHFSLIFDFPLIKDTSTTNWKVSSSGAGDVRTISDAFALASSGDTVTINAGSYTITEPDSTNGVTLVFKPGVNINLDGSDAYIYVGTGGKIVGSENITLSSQIVLYNTPTAREPLSSDNIIGLFGNLCRAIIVSTPGKTIKVGPGEYSIWTLTNEGLIGVMDRDRSKSSIIRLYYPGLPTCSPEPPQPPNMQKTLIKNMRFEVSDESKINALTAAGNEEIEFSNCIFENFDTNGIVTTTMVGLGDTGSVRNGINRFTNCLFRNFKTAVDAYSCTTQTQSPYFTNTVFENCSTDIKFPAGSQAFCNIEANQIHSISVGSVRYTRATAINNLITTNCSSSSASNITLNNISLVDELASDFRPSTRSSLIDNGIAKEDIGASNTDMVFTLSRFLDASIIFSCGDTLILNNGVLTKNTIGSDVQLKTGYTLNLRPVYEIVITANYIDRRSEVRLKLNSSSAVPELPSDYNVFDVKINGYTFTKINAYDLPSASDSTIIQVIPDNIQPAPVANINATASGNNTVVTWTAGSESDIVRYKVYRSPSASPHLPKQIASVSRSTTTYTDPDHLPTSYNYNVISYDSTGNQSASYPALPLSVQMKDDGFNEMNITKPFLVISNLSDQTISGFKVRVWFSREEFLGKQIVVDRYYSNPAAISISKGVHPINSNIIYVELNYPQDYQLAPGGSTPVDGIQFGVHYTNYYPGQWIKSNDWSYQGMSSTYNVTQRVTVYNKDGMLIYGNEPSLPSYTQPPVLTVNDVLGFENCYGWSVSLGSMTQDTATKTQGMASVNFSGGGDQEIISTDLKTTDITGETSTFKMDLYVGTSQPNPYWVGTLQLYINSPSAGIVNTLIGHKELTPLSRGTFNTLSFTIPGNVLNAMRGNYNDFSFRFLLNTNTGSGPYKMDNIRFE